MPCQPLPGKEVTMPKTATKSHHRTRTRRRNQRTPATAKPAERPVELPSASVYPPNHHVFSDDGVPFRIWNTEDGYAPLGMVKEQPFVEDLAGPDGASRFWIRRHHGTGGYERLEEGVARQVLGHMMPRWDFVVALNHTLLQRWRPLFSVVPWPYTERQAAKAWEVWGIGRYPLFHEARAAFWRSVRALAGEVREGVYLYAVDVAGIERIEGWARAGLAMPGAKHGDLLVYSEDPDAAPEMFGDVVEVDAAGRRALRSPLWSRGETDRVLWAMLARRLTPLTHELRFGVLDPLTRFLSNARNWRKRPQLWIVKPTAETGADDVGA
jgi:hypothetical protein